MDDCTAAAAAAEVNFICDDLMMKILSRLLSKPLAVCKCVSKSWRRIVLTLIHSRPLTGLFVSSYNYSDKLQSIEFFNRRDNEIYVNYSLNFLRMLANTKPVDCRDGHLLHSSKNEYYVCNPITRQWISLPHPREPKSRLVYATLVLDEESDLCCYSHFKIVQFEKISFRHVVDGYSSQTEEWRESKAIKMDLEAYFWDRPSVHVDGFLFLPAQIDSLMYDIKEECREKLYSPVKLGNNDLLFLDDNYLGKPEGYLHYAQHLGLVPK